LREVMSGELTQQAARKKYGIGGSAILQIWCKKLYGDSVSLLSPTCLPFEEKMVDPIESELPKDEAGLVAEVHRLRRRLELAELKTEALDVMIDLAESELKIEIRKKSATKQSKK
jgi:transposase